MSSLRPRRPNPPCCVRSCRTEASACLWWEGIAAAVSWSFPDPASAASTLDRSLIGDFSDFGDLYGSGLTLGAGTLGVLIAGRLSGNANLSATGADLARSLLSSGAVVWGLKVAIDRPRPNGGKYSFPSGHTAATFAIAPVLQKHYGWRLGVPAYAVAALTAAARMEDQRHYLSDVLFGAAIGIAAGYWAVGDHELLTFVDQLVIGKRGVGVSFNF